MLRARNGFSLPEALIALTIVAWLGIAMSRSAMEAGKAVNRSRNRNIAAETAYREIEAWRSVGYKSVNPADTSDPHSLLEKAPNGFALGATPRTQAPASLPNGKITVALRRIDSGEFTDTNPTPASPTAAYFPVKVNGADLTNFRCQIDVEVSWRGQSQDQGSSRITSLLVQNPMPVQ